MLHTCLALCSLYCLPVLLQKIIYYEYKKMISIKDQKMKTVAKTMAENLIIALDDNVFGEVEQMTDKQYRWMTKCAGG